ncbi:diguanylate cyclase [Sinorhizobium fredii USDA 205]|uniref:PAS domain S-box protein n=2 Tax=Rhizobium fredii TaxID=380 RepID=A0A844A6H8_RHIFR|nr:PAS domain S-box protein [Sinorhizobium fredii]KSV84295.1 diguanylate cyclase [Sinorhizobium fredii USDA 205]MQW95769.1 PAS domain S-box protein [Sinorhizobium fredii]MQX08137.1 PAS domain S-box protein [Sinorhizobium fredii]GEC30823.1 GGDEF domain-containing protein [Sinorhizobium fredii]GLS10374.1 GGDEF domain-containing protein [Sinorhizobium fredii]
MNAPLPERSSERSHDFFQCLMDGITEPVIVKDDRLRFVFVNSAGCELLGRRCDELLGRTDHDFLPTAEADRIVSIDGAVLSTGEEHRVEEETTTADGATRTLLIKKRCVCIPAGRSEGKFLLSVIEDITELRRAEETLRAREDHYRSLIDLHPQVPWTADPMGAVLDVGPRWSEFTGLSEEETLGSGWAKAVHPQDAAMVHQQWQRSLLGGDPLNIEYRLLTATGHYLWFRARAIAKRDAAGEIVRWYGVLEDVDERRRATEALRESEARFRAIADDAPVMIWVADPSGDTSFFSRLWLETTGQSEAEALGFGWVDVIHPDDREKVQEAFFNATAGKAPVRSEYRLRRADGSWAWVIDVGQPRFSDGAFLGYVGSVLDITERRAAELAQQESQAFIRSIFDSSPDCVRVLDLEGRPLLMNKAGRRIFGLAEGAPLTKTTWDVIGKDADAQKVLEGWAKVRAGETARFEITVRDAKDEERCMDVIAAPIIGREGKPVRMLSIWRDITAAKRASEEISRSQRTAEAAANQLSSVLESTMDSVMLLDPRWRIRYLNENAKRLLRIGDEALGKVFWKLFPKERNGNFVKHCQEVMNRRVRSFFEDYLSSLDRWIEANASPTQDGISIFCRDITEHRRAEEDKLLAQKQMAHLARHDMLTGLANRMFFRECFDRALSEKDAASSMAVLCLDLDGFKAINDTLGHPAGDALLRQVSARLVQSASPTDVVARLGGDEFAIIHPLAGTYDDAIRLAQRIIDTLCGPFTVEGVSATIGASVGIAFAPDDGTSADELIKAADIALYNAKSSGRGTYKRFDVAMYAQLQAHQQVKIALRGALERNEFELHYQPLISLRSRRVTGCEALLRWRNPERGMVAPSEFIPIAEETGLIVPIGEWILDQACRQAAQWPEHVSIAINLSPVQFKHRNLVKTVADALSVSRLTPARLQLEITESVLLDESEHNIQLLQELRGLGVKIAMDDFGTGYSSLGYLRSFPFDKIKVDQAFVRDLPHGKESLAIVKAVAGLGHSLGMTTTIEGVETEDQLAAVNAEGFHEVQGYIFSRPLPPSEISKLIDGPLETGGAPCVYLANRPQS